MAVVIRMKQMGRTHRHFYRIVAIDKRQPRDGRAIEELGIYDPHAVTAEGQLALLPARIKYWQSVGAKASDKVTALLNRHMTRFEGVEAQKAADAAAQKASDEARRAAEAPTA